MIKTAKLPPAVLLVAMIGLVGCRGVQETASDPGGGYSRVEEGVSGQRLLKLKEINTPFRVTEGPHEGEEVTVRITRRDDHWRMELGEFRVAEYVEEGGQILVRAEEQKDEGVRIEYDPPIVVLPARLQPDRPHEGESEMTVFDLASGSKKHSGRARYRNMLLGQKQIDVPAGRYDAYVVRSERRIDVSVADVTVDIETAYAPGEGVIEQKIRQDRKVFGVFGGGEVTEHFVRLAD